MTQNEGEKGRFGVWRKASDEDATSFNKNQEQDERMAPHPLRRGKNREKKQTKGSGGRRIRKEWWLWGVNPPRNPSTRRTKGDEKTNFAINGLPWPTTKEHWKQVTCEGARVSRIAGETGVEKHVKLRSRVGTL